MERVGERKVIEEEHLLTLPGQPGFLIKSTGLHCHEARKKARPALGEPGLGFSGGLPQHQQHGLAVFNYTILIFISGPTQRSRGPSCILPGTTFGACWGKQRTRPEQNVGQAGVHYKCSLPFCCHEVLRAAPLRPIPKASSAFPSPLGFRTP